MFCVSVEVNGVIDAILKLQVLGWFLMFYGMVVGSR